MYLLLAFTYQWMIWHLPLLTPFSTINNMLISVKRFDFALVDFHAPGHANSSEERNWAESSSYILRHVFWKFSNTSADNK